MRTSHSLIQRALTLREDYTGKDLARILDRSPSWLSKLLTAWDRACPELRAEWEGCRITDQQFRLIARLPGYAQGAAVQKVLEVRPRGRRAATDAARLMSGG